MFDNIENKFKALAYVISCSGMAVSLIAFFVMLGLDEDLGLIGLGIFVGVSLISWVSGFFAYGFGEIIELLKELNGGDCDDDSDDSPSNPVDEDTMKQLNTLYYKYMAKEISKNTYHNELVILSDNEKINQQAFDWALKRIENSGHRNNTGESAPRSVSPKADILYGNFLSHRITENVYRNGIGILLQNGEIDNNIYNRLIQNLEKPGLKKLNMLYQKFTCGEIDKDIFNSGLDVLLKSGQISRAEYDTARI